MRFEWSSRRPIRSYSPIFVESISVSVAATNSIDTNGSIITKEGVPALQQDPIGKLFPWRPLRVVDLLPELYLDTDNESYLEITEELEDKYVKILRRGW